MDEREDAPVTALPISAALQANRATVGVTTYAIDPPLNAEAGEMLVWAPQLGKIGRYDGDGNLLQTHTLLDQK